MSARFYRNLFYKTLFFFIVWLVLSESFDWFHMGLGVISAFGVAWLNTEREQTRSLIPPMSIIWYVPWLVVQVVKSGVHLSKLILSPSLPISPKIIRYRTELRKDAGIVLLANSITLTPGTITLEVNGQELVVHAIDSASASDLMDQQIEQRIAGMVRNVEKGP
ncbi:Na+/H+ antiporter subunit E [Stieleria varia]|uniref:Na(+)/H(+) antiporter subunit E1 n=1 Tax=Stieleria varia TaxID=2528005 RepID=A0A5C6B3V4_9BACT|nr:Na+/H+ antiporter subunit E [Stieleria varia]TWU06161.1 Na(+)/H(+) antiporter subunit E1 [Stieleria varia]